MANIINLSSFAEGAVAERFNAELQKILENIADPNTDAAKVRKLTLTLSFKADEKRDIVVTSIQAKSALSPAKHIETKIVMDLDNRGNVTGAELKSGIKGQSYITEDGEVETDVGEKVISFKQQSK
ncbi:replication terminator protein [Fictibacillus phosphorivorans]|uniref:replication terminator protein n=1 Tax=Fictibacillus phosphorivorans TaxID=1221500 RepID=UPI000B1562AA|nr:replication terminator protein [Fictibacillus phosphorivorans]